MNTSRAFDAFRPDVSARSVATVVVLAIAVAASEAPLFVGRVRYTIWAYSVLLVALSLAPLFLGRETPVFQAFALLPAFRLVNLTMPIFTDLTLFWLPFVYGPFVPVVVYLGWQASDGSPQSHADGSAPAMVEAGHDLPWWLGGTRGGKLRWLLGRGWRFLAPPEGASVERSLLSLVARVLYVTLVSLAIVASLGALFVLTASLAKVEYSLITPAPLIPSLDGYHLAVLAVTMIGFVGFVEELIFRGILQKTLERRLGLVPGLVLASSIFALMHAGYGAQTELAFAGGIGLLFGILYDVTDSLVLVAVMHGLLNVFVFGVIPLTGGSSFDLFRDVVAPLLEQIGLEGLVQTQVFWTVTPLL